MKRIGRLLTLLGLTILLTGCDSFTLIGEVNLGADGNDQATGEQTQEQDGPENVDFCWPDKTAMAAEIRSHGYSPQAWPATAAWFQRLTVLAERLPKCE